MENQISDLLLETAQDFNLAKKNYVQRGIKVSEVDIDHATSRKIGRKVGSYISISPTNKTKRSSLVNVLNTSLTRLMRRCGVDGGKVLIVGLGNKQFVVDALGERTLKSVEVGGTNYYKCLLSPQVSQVTGIMSFDIIKGVISTLKPSLIIAIDTLATSKITRLGNCYQLTTAGISPGGGVGNTQPALDKHSLGVPVIAIGVPLIISVGAIFDTENIPSTLAHYMVTPRDIDSLCDYAGGVIAEAINSALS